VFLPFQIPQMQNCCLNLNDTPFPFADANGNCVSFIDEAGNVQAHHTYDAFGGTVSQSGTMAGDFPFRFSSKYLDDETDLCHYGARYYSSVLGGWISRDPLNEFGGDNLFVSCANSS
jgi:RHS repeat-associated protein